MSMRALVPERLQSFLPEARDQLPERVTDAIRAQQDASERLIGWFQLAVVVIFGSLYVVSPKMSAQGGIVLVPWVLSLYLLFTLLRLWIAHRSRLGPALLYLSTVIDISLLFVLIWSFHLQYAQPPSFYLKAPTLLYVFIFIALRALRFEARYVLVGGVAAAAGWLVLAGYAMYVTGGMKMVTRDYAHYMTSNSILIGAEFDKVISILLVTVIIAVAIRRARVLLVRSVAEGAAVKDLSRFFAPEIANRITVADHEIQAGEGQARNAAVLICDIRGFTVFAKQTTPDELMRTLSEYQHRMVTVIQDNGGTIDKFMGDGVMATFGAAKPSDTFAADALRALDAVIEASREWSEEREARGKPALRVGCAVATGPIIFGAVGDETRLEYTVIGDAVNLAAKLENQTKAEKVRGVCETAAFEQALKQGYKPAGTPERRAARTVEGLETPVDLVVLAP